MMFWATFLAFHVSVFFAMTHAWACSQRLLFEDEEWCFTQVVSATKVLETHALSRLRFVEVKKVGSPISLFVGDYGAGRQGIKLQLSGLDGDFAGALEHKGVPYKFFTPLKIYTVPQEPSLLQIDGLAQGDWHLFWQACVEAAILPRGLRQYLEDLFLVQQWGRGALPRKALRKNKSF